MSTISPEIPDTGVNREAPWSLIRLRSGSTHSNDYAPFFPPPTWPSSTISIFEFRTSSNADCSYREMRLLIILLGDLMASGKSQDEAFSS